METHSNAVDQPDNPSSVPAENVIPDSIAKSDIIPLAKKLNKREMELWVGAALKKLKLRYKNMLEEERHIALNKVKSAGGDEHEFVMRPSSLDIEIRTALDGLDKKWLAWRLEYTKKQRNALKVRQDLVNRLRALVDGDGKDIESGFSTFREIRKAWKQTDDISGPENHKLWANYNALLTRFYDHKNIYFELKQLDEQKNLTQKLALCEQAEKLIGMEKVKDAMNRLNILHYEFKHIGPVPQEQREEVWTRFKQASDALRDKWEQQLEVFHKELEANRKEKERIITAIMPYNDFEGKNIGEWKHKTDALLNLKKEWDRVGAAPKQYAGELQKKFWLGYKHFFNRRKKFFKELDEDRAQNLDKKQPLLKQALDLKESTDWDSAAHTFKSLQQTWKKIGPLPKKHAEQMTADFRDACNTFFERYNIQLEQQQAKRVDNFSAKMNICDDIEKATQIKPVSLPALDKLVERYHAIGPPPHQQANNLETRLNTVVQLFLDAVDGLSEREKQSRQFQIHFDALKDDPNKEQKLRNKLQALRKKINQAEHDITVFRNNLEFFGKSKQANEIKDRLNLQLEDALSHLKALKTQSNSLKSLL